MKKSVVITAICAVLLTGCASSVEFLQGTWVSQSVTHPAPFFKDALAGKGPGAVELTLRPNGTFYWCDTVEGMEFSGTYSAGRDTLTLVDGRDQETVRVKYARKKPGLIIETPDGFVFTFRKEGK